MFNLPSFLFISLFSSILIYHLSAQHQEQQSFRNHWCKYLPVFYQKQLLTLGQKYLSRCPHSKYMCVVTPLNKLLVCQADAYWQDSHDNVTSVKQSKPESVIQNVLLFWSNKTLLMQTVESRYSCLREWQGSAHWRSMCQPYGTEDLRSQGEDWEQRTETQVLTTLSTTMRFSSHVFMHLKLQVASNHLKNGTRHHIENFLP